MLKKTREKKLNKTELKKKPKNLLNYYVTLIIQRKLFKQKRGFSKHESNI